ncbi:hypothetical protein O181_043872 [Austropuccinia psidii MF-1]|uniref:Uncharacterized protein n=1 Tax=Austropuccinia psidii MF-1 TaxID=1389203 RepID=A0A9Q3DLE8_9BASI|nr:hypothetical protein [Austropuccinia psidii MF-1]
MDPYNISLPASVTDSADYYEEAPEGIHQSTTPTPHPQTTSSIHQSSSPISSPKVGGPSIVPPITSGEIHQTQSPSSRVAYPPSPSNTSFQEKSSSPKVSGPADRPAIPNPLKLVQIKPLVTYSSSGSDYNQSQPAGQAEMDQFEAFCQREEAHIHEENSRNHTQIWETSVPPECNKGRVHFDESLKPGPSYSSSLKGKSSIMDHPSIQISTAVPSPNGI